MNTLTVETQKPITLLGDIQTAYDKILEGDYGYAGDMLGEVLAQLKKQQEKPLNQEAYMAISSKAAQLAHKYQQTIEDEEHPRQAMEQHGFTARELGLRRTRAHNELMEQLRDEGYKFEHRSEVTDWVGKFMKWFRDE